MIKLRWPHKPDIIELQCGDHPLLEELPQTEMNVVRLVWHHPKTENINAEIHVPFSTDDGAEHFIFNVMSNPTLGVDRILYATVICNVWPNYITVEEVPPYDN